MLNRKSKKLSKEKRKIKEKINLKMENPNDQHDIVGDNEVFSLAKIRTKKTLMELQGALPGMEFSDEDDYDKEEYMSRKPKKVKFDKTDDKNDLYAGLENSVTHKHKRGLLEKEELEDELDSDNLVDSNDEETNGVEHSDEHDDEAEEENPLLNDLTYGSKAEKKSANADLWFSKDSFDFLRDTNEENNELMRYIEEEEMKNEYDEKKNKIVNQKRKKAVVEDFRKDFNEAADSEEDNDTNYDDLKKAKKEKEATKESSKFETVPLKLNAEELALGQMITNSKKVRQELIDDSYNR
jgi:hypothetical protein